MGLVTTAESLYPSLETIRTRTLLSRRLSRLGNARLSETGQLKVQQLRRSAAERGLLKTRGREHTDSTHVLAAVRVARRA